MIIRPARITFFIEGNASLGAPSRHVNVDFIPDHRVAERIADVLFQEIRGIKNIEVITDTNIRTYARGRIE